jgi:peptidoglycan/LPS O-acetylase OafA/YrhL
LLATEKSSNSPFSAPARQPLLRAYMPELDTIRGLAILGVLFYHALYWGRDLSVFPAWQHHILYAASLGQFGVNLFFVLSGFLITGILIDLRPVPDYYRRFYYRRALRILPVYYLTLLLLVIFGITSRPFLIMSLFYSSNLSWLFGITMSYPVLWTLAVEEHFYLLWPTVVKRASSAWILTAAVAMLLLSPLSRFLYHIHGDATHTGGAGYGFYTWSNLDGLALGAVIAVFVRFPGWNRRRMMQFSIAMLAIALVVAAVGYPLGIVTRRNAIGEALQQIPFNFLFAAALGFILLLGTGPWRRFATPSPLLYFGKLSYGLYLYHVMVFMGYDWTLKKTGFALNSGLSPWVLAWLKLIVAGGAATIVAHISRRYFEESFLRLKSRFPAKPARESQPKAAPSTP